MQDVRSVTLNADGRVFGARARVIRLYGISTAAAGTVRLFDAVVLDGVLLGANPVQTVAAGSPDLNITMAGHGLAVNDTVMISGATGPIDGIPAAEINATHTVTAIISAGVFRVRVTTNATTGGVAGGGSVVVCGRALTSVAGSLKIEAVAPNGVFSRAFGDGVLFVRGVFVRRTTVDWVQIVLQA